MHERRGLQRMARSLTSNLGGGDLMKLLIYRIEEPIAGAGLSLIHLCDELRYL